VRSRERQRAVGKSAVRAVRVAAKVVGAVAVAAQQPPSRDEAVHAHLKPTVKLGKGSKYESKCPVVMALHRPRLYRPTGVDAARADAHFRA